MGILIPRFSVTVNEFPDYVTDCPCTFTKEYMMKKIRKKRAALIKEVLDTFEQNRMTEQPIELIGTEDVVIDIDFANMPTKGVLVKRKE